MKNYWLAKHHRLHSSGICRIRDGVYEDPSLEHGRYMYSYTEKGVKWILVASDVAEVLRRMFEEEDSDR